MYLLVSQHTAIGKGSEVSTNWMMKNVAKLKCIKFYENIFYSSGNDESNERDRRRSEKMQNNFLLRFESENLKFLFINRCFYKKLVR